MARDKLMQDESGLTAADLMDIVNRTFEIFDEEIDKNPEQSAQVRAIAVKLLSYIDWKYDERKKQVAEESKKTEERIQLLKAMKQAEAFDEGGSIPS